MQSKYILVLAGVLGSLTITGFASAQEAEAGAESGPAAGTAMRAVSGASAPISTTDTSSGHATGLMLQARIQAQSNLLSIGGSGFLVGYQGSSFALGLGLGLTRLGVSSGTNSGALTLFQVAPTAIIDVWHSKDGRARANILGSVGYARASLSGTVETQTCTGNGNGADTCSSSMDDIGASASLIPVTLGFGGDYFLGRNFALGAEFGVQAMFLAGAKSTANSKSDSIDAGGDLEMAYGALRATFVIGD
jgi:hypothetical protein